MTKHYDVIIAGAGPVGLLLACELGLARASVLVLERDAAPRSPWKSSPVGGRGLFLPSVEALHRRGLLGKVCDVTKRPETPPRGPGSRFGGHFAGIFLNLNQLDLDRFKYRLPGPSMMPDVTTIEDIESVLAERAESLGVTILRDRGFGGIAAENDNDITIRETVRGETFRGRWLVGCDGGRSAVRKAAGFEFAGTEATLTGYAVHCDLDHPENLVPGFRPTKNGMYIFRPPDMLYLLDFDGGAGQARGGEALERGRLQEVLDRVTGKSDVRIAEVRLASAFTDRGKQATQYRRGRVLLAGDSAHVHPPLGAQGMNTGLGDAMNLGWKLGAAVRSEKEEEEAAAGGGGSKKSDVFGLLDTYEAERRPVGEAVLEWNLVQVAALRPGPTGRALQKLMRDVIATDDGANHFMDRVWGLSQRYEAGEGAHAVVGRSAPDFAFADGTRLGRKMEGGRGLLVEFGGGGGGGGGGRLRGFVDGTSAGYEGKVDYVGADAENRCGIRAVLVRPDGVVAWAAEEGSEMDESSLGDALEKWFGI